MSVLPPDMITPGGVLTAREIPVRNVLVGALEEGLAEAVVIGIDRDGHLYAASSTGRTKKIRQMINGFLKKEARGDYYG